MTETSSMSHSELMQLRAKGKKFHRRTQSTFTTEFVRLPEKESNPNEFAQEMAETHNLLSAEITQKVLDVPFNFENDREVIVDDIEDIPQTGAVVPKLPLGSNPMNFIKRRNLSAFTSAVNNKCPVKKVNLFIDLQNINDLTGLDTIYERRNSIESMDLDNVDHLSSGQRTEPNTEKYILDLLMDTGKSHSKQPSSDSRGMENKNQTQGSSTGNSKKSGHSRQSSADFAYKGSKRESFDLRSAKDEEQSVKTLKPTHSKHSSIDFSNKENMIQREIDTRRPIPLSGIQQISLPSKATHVKQSSLNLNSGVMKQISINPQSNRLKAQSSKIQHFNPISLHAKIADQKNTEKSSARRPKKSVERQRNFYTLPSKDNEFYTQLDNINKTQSDKAVADFYRISLVRKEPHRIKELALLNLQNVTHSRNMSLYSAANFPSSSKTSDRQQLCHTPQMQPRRTQRIESQCKLYLCFTFINDVYREGTKQ